MDNFNDMGGYGRQGPPPYQGQNQMGNGYPPGMTPPSLPKPKRSGCAIFLVGCGVFVAIAVVAFFGMIYYGYTRLFDDKPLVVEEQKITEKEIARMAPVIAFLKAGSGEKMSLSVSPAEAHYLVETLILESMKVTSETKLSQTKDWLFRIDFPEDDKLELTFSAHPENKKRSLNVVALMDFSIIDGTPSIKAEQFTVGKINLTGTNAGWLDEMFKNEFSTNPALKKLLMYVPELQISKGSANLKLVSAQMLPEQAAPLTVQPEAEQK